MFTILLILFCLYQAGNISNIYSRSIFAAILLIMIVTILLYFILYIIKKDKKFTITKWLLDDFKRGWVFYIVQVVVIIVMFNQFVYSDWKLLDDRAKESYEFFENETVADFLIYNSFIMPKSVKQSVVVLHEIQRLARIDTENEILAEYEVVKEQYDKMVVDMTYGIKRLNNCLMILCLTVLLRRLWISLGNIGKDIKQIREKKKKEQAE